MPHLSVVRVLSRSVLLWVGAIFVTVGLIAVFLALQEWRIQWHFELESVKAQATILGKSIEKAARDGNPRTKYLITYRFDSSRGAVIENTSEVSVEEWERLEEGSPFPIRYLPSDPNATQLEVIGQWWEPLAIGGFGGLFALIGWFVGWSEFRHALLVWRLSRSGLPAEGTVRKVWATSTTINRVRQWRVSYEFRDHMGRTQQGDSHLLSPDEASEWHAGDKGAVRFDRARPQDSVWIGRPEP